MLQVSYIRQHKETVVEGLSKRNITDPLQKIEAVLALDDDRKKIKKQLDDCLAKSNALSKEIGACFKSGDREKANALKNETTALKTESKNHTERLQKTEKALADALYQIPNIPHQKVKAGTSEDDNEIIYQEKDLPTLNENALPHWELAKKYSLIDFELGAKVSGAGFPFYTGKGAALQRALINYFLTENVKAGYREVQPPLLINEDSGYGTGQLPDKEGQMYHITEDDLYLIPTSEVPLINMYRNRILSASDFPICHTGYTPCFRREAGSYGAHVRGLNRLHQFDKVEIIRIEKPENSYAVLDEMVDHVKKLVTALKLPYRILRLCGGDLGFTANITYDFEIYSAAQKRWLEISSVSNVETFQANRLKLRYKNEAGNRELPHTLNGSALALPRVLAAILENNQTEMGIYIPEVLVPYTGFEIIA